MAMTLPITIPSTPSSGNSPLSDDSGAPHTPISPNMQSLNLPDQSRGNSQPANAASAQMKRKPSRRANTAERRATHNAVERQRRETLNGRFLDLAALLPNLSQIRRPSKSSIVNSSIAHINASRRHRLLAARELRLLKVESDALRRELNEWRDRSGLPRVEEPIRGEGFAMVLSGELEVIAAIPEDDDEENGQNYNGYGGEDDDEYGQVDMEDPRIAMMKNANTDPFAHSLPPANNANGNGLHLAHILPRPTQAGPIVVTSPTNVSFENPAMSALYEPHPQFPSAHFLQQQQLPAVMDPEKIVSWNAGTIFGQQQQQMLQAQRSLYTPPATSHGLSSSAPSTANGPAPPNPFADPASQAFFANFQRQQQQQQMAAMQQQQMYGTPERDDASSVGSSRGGRERSGSLSGSGYSGSPQHHGSSGGYELASPLSAGEYNVAVPRRMNLQVNPSTGGGAGSWGADADLGLGMMKQGLSSPISVGGGGNSNGFAMMM